MPQRFDGKLLTVEVTGVDLSRYVDSVTTHVGFDLMVPTASVKLLLNPGGIEPWAAITVNCGLQGTGCAGNLRRFTGFVTPTLGGQNWPYNLTLEARGHLVLAERTKVVASSDADDPWLPGLEPAFDEPGIDLSVAPDDAPIVMAGPAQGSRWSGQAGDPWCDQDMAVYVLAKCGCGAYLMDIQGTGRLLGTETDEAGPFTWGRGQSGLDFIKSLDTATTRFRTFEDADGWIRRLPVSPDVPFVDDRINLTEGEHIYAGLTCALLTDRLANRVIVSGYDFGEGAEVYSRGVTLLGGTLPPVPTNTEEHSSGMIEFALEADTLGGTTGLSCELLAGWLASEVNRGWYEAKVPTWRDESFAPGHTGYLNIVHPMTVTQALWIRGVTTTMARKQVFKQEVDLYGHVYGNVPPQLGSMTLPATLDSYPLG